MAAKPTLRKNGTHMITMCVTYHLSGVDLTNVLARELFVEGSTWEMTREELIEAYGAQAAQWGKGKLMDQARESLAIYGHENLWTVSDDTDGEVKIEAARRRVAELYPEMV